MIKLHLSLIVFKIHMWLCHSVCLSGYRAPFGHNEKRYRPEIRYTNSPRPYLKTGFCFFPKKRSRGPLSSKNCRVTWIFCPSPRSPSLLVYLYVCASFLDQIKNDRDLKIITHTPHKHFLKLFFFEKLILRVARLKKLLRHMDFRISSRLPCLVI